MSNDQCREAFEKFIAAVPEFEPRQLYRRDIGDKSYCNQRVELAWRSWQAARDARTQQKPEQGAAGPVAVVCSGYELRWIGSGPIAPIIHEQKIKIGDKLFTAPPAPDADAKDAVRLEFIAKLGLDDSGGIMRFGTQHYSSKKSGLAGIREIIDAALAAQPTTEGG